MYNERSWWPTLTFGPINLWSAPYVGRAYHYAEYMEKTEPPEPKAQIPKLRLALSIKEIIRNR